jgi:hypothetical protein
MLGQPWLQPVLGRSVRRRGVDVVDPPLGDGCQRGVGAFLTHPAERGRPKMTRVEW